jgi:glutamyl-tRNA synthetase
MSSDRPVRTRFAPSPTGFMHVGGVRTALYAWAYARKNNGSFILRIEDTDKSREVAGSIGHIMESLKWVGIDWDEGPDIGGPYASYLQSDRLDLYNSYAKKLLEKGFAYADPYTEEEVESFRQKSIAEGKPFLFRDYRPENPGAWDGSKPLRFKTPIKKYTWNDLARGELSAGEEAVDDFVLIKSDGYPTYNLAHIIDDYEMKISHIMRGDEFISSTPKFLALYEALEIERPEIATLPPIMGADGKKKLGKRDGAKDLLDYKKEGYLPEAMVNFLAFIGWNPGDEREILTPDEFVQSFDIKGIGKSGGKFNEEKLDWVNKEHLKKQKADWDVFYINTYMPNELREHQKYDSLISKIAPVILERISKGSDIPKLHEEGELSYYFDQPVYDSAKLVWKTSTKEKTLMYFEKLADILNKSQESSFTDTESIKNLFWNYAEEQGRGDVLWPLRVSLSGRDKSPDPFTLLHILGKDEGLKRVQYAYELLQKLA